MDVNKVDPEDENWRMQLVLNRFQWRVLDLQILLSRC